MIYLLEPKVSDNQANKICSSFGFDNWARVEAVGFSGGICNLWKETIKVKIIKTNPQYVSLQVYENDTNPWILTVVYGSPSLS